MPDRRRRRGAHPADADGFGERALESLRRATADLAWLRGRGYPETASLSLVGDRYRLRARQRAAVRRCAVADDVVAQRLARRLEPVDLRGRILRVDGYNVLLTVEMALGGGVLLLGRDGVLRDMAAMSGHFKKVEQTEPALLRIGSYLADLDCEQIHWYFDRPVSNSGRLSALLERLAAEREWRWTVELVPDPDPILAVSPDPVATADGGILDQGPPWFDLARLVVESSTAGSSTAGSSTAEAGIAAWLVDLSD